MKVVFTGGGTGGHFYPIIAVAEELRQLAYENKLVETKLYYLSDTPYDQGKLTENGITFRRIPAGKWRRYFSWLNFWDVLKTFLGVIKAVWQLFLIYPDVVFSKGGYASFPTVWAARFLMIPVFVHESDAHPGRANMSAAKFAARIAVSYPETLEYFPKGKTALTGNPIRKRIKKPISEGSFRFLDFDPSLPVVFVLGGSQGSMNINNVVLDALPDLLKDHQIVHQVGRSNYKEIKERADYFLTGDNDLFRQRYKIYDYLNDEAMTMAAGAASLVVSRAGSGIFEIAAWGVPSIVIPIPEDISHDQKYNALAFAKTGATVIIEENNLTPSVLSNEIRRILTQPEIEKQMKLSCRNFGNLDAAKLIAKEVISITLKHERN